MFNKFQFVLISEFASTLFASPDLMTSCGTGYSQGTLVNPPLHARWSETPHLREITFFIVGNGPFGAYGYLPS